MIVIYMTCREERFGCVEVGVYGFGVDSLGGENGGFIVVVVWANVIVF